MFRIPLPWPDSSVLLSLPFGAWHPVVRAVLLAAMVLAPLGLLVTLYRYELRLVKPLTAASLLGLRLAALLLILGLVCLQPIYARDRVHELPGRVLVAVDRSDSMNVVDPQRPPADKLRLARALGLANGVQEEWLARWVSDHERQREPRWLGPDEASGDPARRRELEGERRKLHDEVLAAVDRLTRAETARLVLGDGVKLLSAVAGRHQVDLVGFHRDLWEGKPGQPDELFHQGGAPKPGPGQPGREPGGQAFTDLRAPLERALERSGAGQGKVLGVVLLTDGQHNSGKPPGEKARELGRRKIPVFPVALGSVRPPPDAAIVSVRGPNHTMFKDVEAEIAVRVKIAGLPAGDYQVSLLRQGQEGAAGAEAPRQDRVLGEHTVRHDGKDRVYTETFPVKMDKAGTQTLVAVVKPLEPGVKETWLDNNRLATTVGVADDRAKVLLVDGEARWEYHYLAEALKRDRLIDLKTVVFEQPRLNERLTPADLEDMGLPAQQWPAAADALSAYQCVILGDVDPENWPLAERQRLERYVADGGGTLIVLAGRRSMPLGYPEMTPAGEPDPLRRLLPIETPQVLAPEEGVSLSLSRAGAETAFMKLTEEEDGDNEALWAGHPRPWPWAVAGRVKPAATALAGWLDPADERLNLTEREKRHGVVVRHNYGFGRVLFVGLDSTWRWRFKVGDAYHHKFWGAVLRWAASDKPLMAGNAFVRFGTPQPVYRRGEAVEVIARLNDALGPVKPDLLAGARVVRLPDRPGEEEKQAALAPLARRPAQPRVLDAKKLRDLPAGRYAVELAIPDLADRLKDKAGKPLRSLFTVLPPESTEAVELETNRPLLDDLAVRSGGKVFTPEDASELAKLLNRQSVPQVEHHEQRLWQWWGMLAAVVGLLSLEWAGRKWAGLP
jgi:hypothetical protein